MEANKKLIEKFYTAFKNGNAEEMISCYHQEIEFEDPAFGILKGDDVGAMWKMLIERGKGQIEISFKDINAGFSSGTAYWEAIYPFSKTGRIVHNKIHASFIFKDGKIIKHTDKFDFYKWLRQAFGPLGWALGFTPILKKKVRSNALLQLKNYKNRS
jgi:ketosteroid isomerase-like protein